VILLDTLDRLIRAYPHVRLSPVTKVKRAGAARPQDRKIRSPEARDYRISPKQSALGLPALYSGDMLEHPDSSSVPLNPIPLAA
jgi:hypothetical protein